MKDAININKKIFNKTEFSQLEKNMSDEKNHEETFINKILT